MKASFSKISSKEQAYIFMRLSFLIKAGISLQQSIQILEYQTKSKKQKKIFKQIYSDISQGSDLSHSLEKVNNIFSNSSIQIIKIGEEIGSLSDNLTYLSEELQKRDLLKRKIIAALVYPAFIALGTIALSVFLIAFIFPKIRPLFTNLKVNLPLSTRILIGFSDFTQKFGVLLITILISVILAVLFLVKKNKHARLIQDKIMISLPLFGKIIKYYTLATITRNIGIILKAGIPIQRTLTNTGEAVSNTVYKESLKVASESVSAGDQLSVKFSEYPALFPTLVVSMIAVAETTGTLSETMLYLSNIYEYEVEDATKNISSTLEPVLMVAMGLIVGFISLSIVTPIYSLTQNIRH